MLIGTTLERTSGRERTMSIPHPFPSVIETSVKDISDYTFLVGIGRRYTRSPIRDEYAYLPSDA